MKKLLYILIISVVAFSCDVFDVEPEASVSDNAAITNAGGLKAAVNGLYDRLQSGYHNGRLFIAGDISTDISQSVGTWDFYREMDTYRVSPDNNENRDLFTAIYQVVNQANNIIAAAPGVADATDAVKNQSLGEAYFARGISFFDAAMYWGGIPGVYGTLGISLPLEPSREAVTLPRASIQETWDQIEADLQQAVSLLPETGAPARITKAAARGMLARMYLYLKEYGQASDFATQVINDTKFKLPDDYTTVFTGKLSSESIFEMQFDNADQSAIRTWYIPTSAGGRGDLAAHDEFYNAIPAEDERKKLYAYDANAKFYYPTKYSKAGNIDNIHVLRLAEMYLIRAEADFLAGKGNPLADVNTIRVRANLAPLVAINSVDDILNERKVEFAFEGQRWYDLVRTGKALTVLASVPRNNSPGAPATLTDAKRQVFPIPSVELNANPNSVQNDAYK
ncbi:MAG: RagB/SusD family nutrient uptake outer membrane protein [Saprospiraceae bacterium]|nr:RagB/SusD family nutrient uptake outer membrane protein [Saprospiraceae bacterium]